MLVWDAKSFRGAAKSPESKRFWYSLLRDIRWASESYERSGPGALADCPHVVGSHGEYGMADRVATLGVHVINYSRN